MWTIAFCHVLYATCAAARRLDPTKAVLTDKKSEERCDLCTKRDIFAQADLTSQYFKISPHEDIGRLKVDQKDIVSKALPIMRDSLMSTKESNLLTNQVLEITLSNSNAVGRMSNGKLCVGDSCRNGSSSGPVTRITKMKDDLTTSSRERRNLRTPYRISRKLGGPASGPSGTGNVIIDSSRN